MTDSIQSFSADQLSYLYAYGCIAANNATTPNTQIDMSMGQVRDSNDNVDIVIATLFTIDATVNGYNGLDTGSLGASLMYDIYAISDSYGHNPSGYIMTLDSNSVPLLPQGYDSYRKVAYWPTDSSSHFLKGYMTGVSNDRGFTYDAPAASVSAGNATSYASGLISLLNVVPNVNNLPVNLQAAFTPNAANDTLKMQGGASTGDAYTFNGQVASVALYCDAVILAQTVSSAPKYAYKVSAGTDAVTITVQGFKFTI